MEESLRIPMEGSSDRCRLKEEEEDKEAEEEVSMLPTDLGIEWEERGEDPVPPSPYSLVLPYSSPLEVQGVRLEALVFACPGEAEVQEVIDSITSQLLVKVEQVPQPNPATNFEASVPLRRRSPPLQPATAPSRLQTIKQIWAPVKGYNDIKKEIFNNFRLHQLAPAHVKLARGILLFGPSGTGKSEMAACIGRQFGATANFQPVSCTDVISSYR